MPSTESDVETEHTEADRGAESMHSSVLYASEKNRAADTGEQTVS